MIDYFQAVTKKKFNLKRISGLVLWLDALQENFSDDDTVGTWTDRSGQGNDAIQTTEVNKPVYKTNILNGRPILRFDGSNSFLDLTSALDISEGAIFIVARNNDGTNGSCPLSKKSSSNGQIWMSPTQVGIQPNTGIYYGGSIGTTAFHIVGCKSDGSNWNVFADRTDGTPASDSSNIQPDCIGRYNSGGVYDMDGDIAEIIVLNVEPSSDEIDQIYSYLENKWNI